MNEGQGPMAETRRKLTTIFSADVQDYTRLMGTDEEGTLVTLKRYRDAMAALISAHDGRVINTWGDGLIAEFPSVVEAVRAAIDTQNELAGFNVARPAEQQMQFRIGINLGDVIEVGNDIYGDGVNIAARLQTSAQPGGIVISNTVYDQVRNKMSVGFDFLGPLAVKNVSEAVPSYSVRIGEADGRTTRAPGMQAAEPALQQPATSSDTPRSPLEGPKLYGMLAAAAVAFAAVNLMTGSDNFWAKWPILVVATLAALRSAHSQHWLDRRTTTMVVFAAAITVINLYTWDGTFWAKWPMLGFAIAIAVRWFGLRR